MVNFKNLLASIVSVSVLAAGFVSVPVQAQTLVDAEFDAALSWAYDTGLTKFNTTDAFMPYNLITREQATKFFGAMGAQTLCLEADTSANCSFADVSATQSDPSLVPFVGLACEMGLVKGSNGMFFPMNNMSKAEAITVLVRALRAANGENPLLDETATPWYSNYFMAAANAGITNDSIQNIDRSVTRYEVLLMLYRAANAVEIECSEDVDLSDLLSDLFGDTDADDMDNMDSDDNSDDAGNEDDNNDDADESPTVSDGMVMASLSSSTPNGDTVPGLATIEVAAFDFTADGEDVELETVVLERFGLGSDDVIDDVTLLVDGEVVTKSRSFNSDDSVTLSLNPEIMIEAGETVTVVVLAEIGDAEGTTSNPDNVSNEEFAIGLVDFETNGDEDTSNLPIIANEFEVGGTNAAEIEVSADGSLSDVELGEMGAEIASFTIENDSDDMVFITTITLEDDESEIEKSFENFILEHNGNEVAMVADVDDKYLTFTLATPVEIDENEEEDFKVLADVIGGAGDQVNLIIDEKIYIRGYDERYGFGLAVTFSPAAGYIPAPQDINAGELTFVEIDIDRDEIRSDREDIVIAAFDLNVNAGQDLSLEDIKFTVTANNASAFTTNSLLSHFDEVELIVTIDGSRRTYDLDTNGTAGIFTAEDDDIGIFLPEGSDIMIALEVETINEFPASSIGQNFSVSIAPNCSATTCQDVEIIENDDDEEVTDIVPSSITFDTLEFVNSEVEINAISLTSVEVVKGAENVDVIKFEVETDDVSGVFVEGFVFNGQYTDSGAATTAINQQVVTALRVWMKTSAGYELLEAEGGFDIDAAGNVTLDDFDEVFIDVADSMEFLLTVDVSDNDNLAGDTFSFSLVDADIEDDDNTQLCDLGTGIPACTADSNRTVRVTGAGELTVEADNTDTEVDDEKYVLAGASASDSDFVASFELTAENEAIEIEDMTLNVAGAANFGQAVQEVVIYADDKSTVLFTETVTNNTKVVFNNIDFVVEEGSTNIYLKVVADTIGDNENGEETLDVTFTLEVSTVEGVDSGDDAAVMYENFAVGAATASNSTTAFSIVPVKFSDVEFVTSAAGVNVATTTSDGNDKNLAILKLTADSWNNSDRADGSDLEAYVNELRFTTSASAAQVMNYEIRRVGNGSTNYIDCTIAADVVTCPLFSGSNMNRINTREFVSAEVGYYLVRADVTAGASNTSVKLTLDNLNEGTPTSISYVASDNAGAPLANTVGTFTYFRVEDDLVESTDVQINNN